MGKVTKFLVELLPPSNIPKMVPAPPKLNLKDKVEDGEIDLSMCDLQDVPVKDIAAIKKAHSLDLSNNHISILPKNFPTLVNIIKLDLSKNELKELPENFGDLIKLKHLDLYKNQLQHLPLSFSKLQALKWLDLKDNPLVPAIANIAGPCLDSKQCQKCAKDIVIFYSQLQSKVEEERSIREQRRQKDLQINAQKLKQEKKSKKEKKVKRSKENGEVGNGDGEVKENSADENDKNQTLLHDTKVTKSCLLFKFIKILFVIIFMLGTTLFILMAAKIECLRQFQDNVNDVWRHGVASLPNAVTTVGSHLCELSKHPSINLIYNEFTNVAKNVTQAATELYTKIFGKKLLIHTN